MYDKADEFISRVEARVKKESYSRQDRQSFQTRGGGATLTRNIEHFRSNPAYGGDKTRSDLAYAIYALCHGIDATDVAHALQSRDLSHKGNEKRQVEYVDRTIKKAMAVADRAENLSR